jgi:hypothetical protein
MTEPWTLTIPKGDLPWINTNDRKHWRKKASETCDWRWATYRALHDGKRIEQYGRLDSFTSSDRVLITATIHKTRAGRWDAANLYPTIKAIVDQIVLSGYLYDDDNDHVKGPLMLPGEKRATACVVITIEPAS